MKLDNFAISDYLEGDVFVNCQSFTSIKPAFFGKGNVFFSIVLGMRFYYNWISNEIDHQLPSSVSISYISFASKNTNDRRNFYLENISSKCNLHLYPSKHGKT